MFLIEQVQRSYMTVHVTLYIQYDTCIHVLVHDHTYAF